MLISGGFNIYPSDLETVLAQHPAVADAAVIGAASKRWGETPVAYVVAQVGAQGEAGDILDWVNQHIGKTQRLAKVLLVDELPRNAIGKVLKRDLRQRFNETFGELD